MKKKLYWQLPFLVFLIVGTVFIVRQQRSTPYQHDEGQVFGTFYHITYQNDSSLPPSLPKISLPEWPSTVDTGKLGMSVYANS